MIPQKMLGRITRTSVTYDCGDILDCFDSKLRLNLGTLFKNNARHLSIGTSGFFLLYNLDLGRGEKPISRSFIETGIIDAFLVLELIRNLNLDMDDLWVNLGMDWNPVYFYIYVI